MTPYRRISPDAGVTEYEIGDDFVRVRFKEPAIYKYTTASAGEGSIATMKALAIAGKGLSTYIAQNRPPYESRS